jgi:hypothetical protein
VRPLDELRDVDDPAWPAIRTFLDRASADVVVLPVEHELGGATLERIQVTAASSLGALALETGGLLVDHGWLRVLGGGAEPMNLAAANGLAEPADVWPGQLLVAFDVLGGRFAVNGGSLPGALGEVSYYGPDALSWWPLDLGHSGFVEWVTTSSFAEFNEHLRWPGWEAEVGALTPAQGLSVDPPPYSVEGRDLGAASRRPVPIAELLATYESLGAPLDAPAGGSGSDAVSGDT